METPFTVNQLLFVLSGRFLVSLSPFLLFQIQFEVPKIDYVLAVATGLKVMYLVGFHIPIGGLKDTLFKTDPLLDQFLNLLVNKLD